MAQLIIPVSEVLQQHAEHAVVRLGYLYPKISFSCQVHTILVSSETEIDEIKIRRDVLYALYREKIYAETLSMRQALVTMVSAS
jgi:hypothetical protein